MALFRKISMKPPPEKLIGLSEILAWKHHTHAQWMRTYVGSIRWVPSIFLGWVAVAAGGSLLENANVSARGRVDSRIQNLRIHQRLQSPQSLGKDESSPFWAFTPSNPTAVKRGQKFRTAFHACDITEISSWDGCNASQFLLKSQDIHFNIN